MAACSAEENLAQVKQKTDCKNPRGATPSARGFPQGTWSNLSARPLRESNRLREKLLWQGDSPASVHSREASKKG